MVTDSPPEDAKPAVVPPCLRSGPPVPKGGLAATGSAWAGGPNAAWASARCSARSSPGVLGTPTGHPAASAAAAACPPRRRPWLRPPQEVWCGTAARCRPGGPWPSRGCKGSGPSACRGPGPRLHGRPAPAAADRSRRAVRRDPLQRLRSPTWPRPAASSGPHAAGLCDAWHVPLSEFDVPGPAEAVRNT